MKTKSFLLVSIITIALFLAGSITKPEIPDYSHLHVDAQQAINIWLSKEEEYDLALANPDFPELDTWQEKYMEEYYKSPYWNQLGRQEMIDQMKKRSVYPDTEFSQGISFENWLMGLAMQGLISVMPNQESMPFAEWLAGIPNLAKRLVSELIESQIE